MLPFSKFFHDSYEIEGFSRRKVSSLKRNMNDEMKKGKKVESFRDDNINITGREMRV